MFYSFDLFINKIKASLFNLNDFGQVWVCVQLICSEKHVCNKVVT